MSNTVFLSMLNNTLTVSRRVRVSDGQGGWTIAYEEVGSIDARVRPLSSKERIVAGSEEQQITHVIYCVADEDITRGDIVEDEDGWQAEILGIREPSLAGEHWEIDALERQNESAGSYGS